MALTSVGLLSRVIPESFYRKCMLALADKGYFEKIEIGEALLFGKQEDLDALEMHLSKLSQSKYGHIVRGIVFVVESRSKTLALELCYPTAVILLGERQPLFERLIYKFLLRHLMRNRKVGFFNWKRTILKNLNRLSLLSSRLGQNYGNRTS